MEASGGDGDLDCSVSIQIYASGSSTALTSLSSRPILRASGSYVRFPLVMSWKYSGSVLPAGNYDIYLKMNKQGGADNVRCYAGSTIRLDESKR